MAMRKIAIIGAGGFAREVLDIFEAINERNPSYDVLGFIVDPAYGTPGTLVNDRPILGGFEWLADHRNEVSAVCGVGAPELRRRLIARARETGVRFASVIHPGVITTRWNNLGEGTIIAAGCILTNRIRIGDHVQVNLDCTIGHDVVLENFVTLAPGVHVSGDAVLEEGCSMGTGSVVIEKKKIGAWSIVGAGSTIVHDVPRNTTVVGIPGKVIKTRPEGWHLS
jgi:sugar O-acyltransferase (sialic acid O-acetyltransferase NeuD family)